MIMVDGRETGLAVQSFENLEQLLVKVMEDKHLEGRIVTDVLVNKEPFSEIYPHQAEDVDASGIETVEIVSVATSEMAVNITRELYKVVTLMDRGARRVADLFRKADDAEALEVYQDLMDVTRDFLGMIGVLRNEFSLKQTPGFNQAANEISALFSEMLEVLENEDWILLADLLEYEFIPAVERWKKVIAQLREDIKEIARAA
ncbi:hypothetical protein NNJEOMEG_02397 [Fundidesulfovibrio magnetotacticus]|uniref:Uncharacterized protein n=1 Tax=Fundidesulfovibrio magnetotacticus TaxID=2730080 RepID=A0A6V8LVC8_9BACT|nr:hypothetical protein [Fundidesulfovibrio magnetotacticus]GFK94551.1 hypothetical protein NNJEOMEG_02397 [Fundidesulfovibrio magnetotacticus]